MKKLFIAVIVLFLVSMIDAYAWHCVDTDQATPNGPPFGTWGDNGLPGGTNIGWLEGADGEVDAQGNLPDGCILTGNINDPVVCNDQCIEFSLREFYCTDRPGFFGETVIRYSDDSQSPYCQTNEVPEFTTLGAGLVLAGAGLYMYRRRR